MRKFKLNRKKHTRPFTKKRFKKYIALAIKHEDWNWFRMARVNHWFKHCNMQNKWKHKGL